MKIKLILIFMLLALHFDHLVDKCFQKSNAYFLTYRWYDSKCGRFLQSDTINPDPSQLLAYNHYAYTLNNPFKYTDPSGHIPDIIKSHQNTKEDNRRIDKVLDTLKKGPRRLKQMVETLEKSEQKIIIRIKPPTDKKFKIDEKTKSVWNPKDDIVTNHLFESEKEVSLPWESKGGILTISQPRSVLDQIIEGDSSILTKEEKSSLYVQRYQIRKQQLTYAIARGLTYALQGVEGRDGLNFSPGYFVKRHKYGHDVHLVDEAIRNENFLRDKPITEYQGRDLPGWVINPKDSTPVAGNFYPLSVPRPPSMGGDLDRLLTAPSRFIERNDWFFGAPKRFVGWLRGKHVD